MSKLILSGDLTYFRPDMLVKIIEALRLDGILSMDAQEKGVMSILQGKVVGAQTATDVGLGAMTSIVRWSQGTFSFRLLASQNTIEFKRHDDLMAFPDNATLFKYLYSHARPVAAAAPAGVAAVPVGAPPTPGMPGSGPLPGGPPVPPGPAPASGTTGPIPPPAGVAAPAMPPAGAPRAPGRSGPMARVPQLTDKGRVTLRTLQTNYAMRGIQAEDDIWRVLGKVDGRTSLFEVGDATNLRGERLMTAVDDLVRQGLVKFVEADPVLEQARSSGSKLKFGEYMVAKGLITDIQLETALNRQRELAQRNRYMWLGEILVELNMARPSQVKEVVELLKRQ